MQHPFDPFPIQPIICHLSDGASASSQLVGKYPEASMQVPRYADTVPPTAAPVTSAPTSAPSQASYDAGVVAASVVGSIAALAAIVFGLWFNRKVLWKKIKGDKRTMVVPVNVDMDVISVVPPLIDSQKECKSHSIQIWDNGTSPKSDLGNYGDDDVVLFSELQKVVPIPVASPSHQLPFVTNDDALKRHDGEYSTASRGVGAKLAAMLLQNQDMERWRVSTASDNGDSVGPATTTTATRTLFGNDQHHETEPEMMPSADVDVDEAYHWLLHQFSDMTHLQQHTDNHNRNENYNDNYNRYDNDGSVTSVVDDVSILHLDVDNLTLSTRQSPLVTDRSSSTKGRILAIIDEVTPFADDHVTSAQVPVTDKSLASSVIGLNEKPTAAPIQRENIWTKGKIQPVATDIDENISVHPRSSKQAFAAIEAPPKRKDSEVSSCMVVSNFDLIGDDDESLASRTVKESNRDIVLQDSEIEASAEDQMVEIRKQIKEKKALLLAAKGDSKGKEPTPDTRISKAEEEGSESARPVVLSQKAWL